MLQNLDTAALSRYNIIDILYPSILTRSPDLPAGEGGRSPGLRHNMNRKRLFLALALAIALVLLCASAALADRPIKVSMELSNSKFSGPKTVNVSITVTNVGDGDLPGPVTLYYPNGKKIEEFGSPTLSVGASKRWSGEWTVTKSELEAGKVTFAVKYSAYDGAPDADGEPSLQSHKINFSKKITYTGADPEISVSRTITPTTAQKGQEISVVYEIANVGEVEVTSVNIKENAGISSKSGTIDSIAPGETKTHTFTATMGSKDLTSAATVSYKAGGKSFSKKVESATIKYGEVKLSAALKADKKGGAPGDTVKLTLTLKNSGNLDFTNVTVTDPALGTVFSGETVKAGETVTLEKELTITETQELQFTVRADESTGKGVETATGRVKVIAMDPTQQIVLTLEAKSDRELVYKIPGTVRFTVTVHNDSAVEVKNITVKAVETTLYSFDSIPAGQSASFVRDVDVNLEGMPEGRGTFQFTATCRDQLDQTLSFTSNPVVIAYSEPTPVPTEAPMVTPPAPATEPIPTDQPEPEWLSQAENIAESAKWILAGVAGVLLILLLIGAVRRGKSRSESKKAMDHLEGANYRDYSAEPKHRRRNEISNGGTAEAPAAGEGKQEEEGTAQNSELMAETLRRLYSEKPEEKAAEAAEAAEEAAAEGAEAVAGAAEDAAGEAAETVKEAEQEVQKAAEEAGGARRRRGRKQE